MATAPTLITACTGRKRIRATETLRAANLASGTVDEVAAEWCRRLTQAKDRVEARELYAGRGFSQALKSAERTGASLSIVSAGLGLISSEQRVPSYDLTLAPSSDQSIARRVTGRAFEPTDWWSLIQRPERNETPVADRIRRETGRICVLALSTPYLALIARDLDALDGADLGRVRIATRGVLSASASSKLAACVLPYDDRLDGPDSPIPGTRRDFAQRAATHFLSEVIEQIPHGGLEEHKLSVAERLEAWAFPNRPARRRCSDEEIVRLILDMWEEASGTSARMLKLLRDERAIACEQGRFASLFKKARTRREKYAEAQ
ncbi:MAG: hypothetical protein GKR94_21020 [Gammaproteobacteria bacterium]|nr:hypothetical protein [Gammaproteobacteria bacterium]